MLRDRDEFDDRVFAALQSFPVEAYSVEVAERMGSKYARVKSALDRLQRAGRVTSRFAPVEEHGGKSGLGRRYFKPVP